MTNFWLITHQIETAELRDSVNAYIVNIAGTLNDECLLRELRFFSNLTVNINELGLFLPATSYTFDYIMYVYRLHHIYVYIIS